MTAPEAAVRVFLCDDSAAVRGAMSRLLVSDPALRVVGQAADGRAAIEALSRTPADVVLLDLEMPVLDGLSALPRILALPAAPTVIVASALTQPGGRAAMAALRAGAADYIPKPSAASGGIADPAFREEVLAKVKGWARVRRRAARLAPGGVAPRLKPPRLLAIGASTGGPQALAALFSAFRRPPAVPIAVVQHMPAGFTRLLAEHLATLGAARCVEAEDGMALTPGLAVVAPGDRHLRLKREGGVLRAALSQDPPVNFCRPAVDPLFASAEEACPGGVLAAVLTGMGQDGLAGARAIAAGGGQVVAQDEASSVVWGMPGAVARAGIGAIVLPLPEIGPRLAEAVGAA
ncbi:MAG: chemotaxis-specific protein-glutamate methyltransferase CheB [Acetobacteraceae bacterium]|nr:chemotaxis-specific protein-glutamate methyltransferase CheB [Acetobacteraceae bacterium]MDW8399490.1 chemotaxis-specific protein-glutamate methyltransferase CheB [Acetobacteraceae bacterium]